MLDQYVAASDRYDRMPFRSVGRSGLRLPAISLGCWHNFGDDTPIQRQRDILRRAFDLGVTHFDLANNYGPPYGSAEINVAPQARQNLPAGTQAAHQAQLCSRRATPPQLGQANEIEVHARHYGMNVRGSARAAPDWNGVHGTG